MNTMLQQSPEGAIAQSARLYYGLVVIFVAYLVAATTLIDRNDALSHLRSVDTLYALVQLANADHESASPLSNWDLLELYARAGEEGVDTQYVVLPKFSSGVVPDGQRIPVDMRTVPGARCVVGVVPGAPGARFDFATFQVVGKIHFADSENVRLVSFGRCVNPIAAEFNAVIFKTIDGESVVALPESFERAFPPMRPPAPFRSFDFTDSEIFLGKLPPLVQEYVELDSPLVIHHIDALRAYLLRYATIRTGKFYSAAELDTAVAEIFQEVEKYASFAGVNATVQQVVRLGPLAFLVFSWELWRRVRRLPLFINEELSCWFPYDNDSLFATAVAWLYALVPAAVGIAVVYLFVEAQGLELTILGRTITLSGLLSFDYPVAPPIGWRGPTDLWASISAPIFFALLGLLTLTSIRLVQIVMINRRRHGAAKLGHANRGSALRTWQQVLRKWWRG